MFKRLLITALILIFSIPTLAAEKAGSSYPNVFDPSDTSELILYGQTGTHNIPWSVVRSMFGGKLDATDAMLTAITAETAGANCANGGQKIDIGKDDNADGILDAGEIDATRYVCNGVDGAGDVVSVNSQTGTVVVTAADVGLESVDNTADADKLVSAPQQTALDLKANTVDLGTGAFADTGNTAGDVPFFVACGDCSDTQYVTESTCTGASEIWTLTGDICLNVELDIANLTDANNLIAQTLSQLTCTSGQIPKWNGSVFTCGDDEVGSGGSLTISEQGSDPVAVDLATGDMRISTASGDLFYKSATGFYSLAGTYAADPATYTLSLTLAGLIGDSVNSVSVVGPTDISGLNSATYMLVPSFGLTNDTMVCTGAAVGVPTGDSYPVDMSDSAESATCTLSVNGGACTSFQDNTGNVVALSPDIRDATNAWYAFSSVQFDTDRTICQIDLFPNQKAGDISTQDFTVYVATATGIHDFVPDTWLATSNSVTGVNTWDFTTAVPFTFSTPYTIPANTKVFFVIGNNGVVDASNYAELQTVTVTPTTGFEAGLSPSNGDVDTYGDVESWKMVIYAQ